VKAAYEIVFKALADPTRREIFECLSRDGEQTINPLIKAAGISQQALRKHLQVLKLAGLLHVSEGFRPRYTAQYDGTASLTDWLNAYGRPDGEGPTASRCGGGET
jgi:DNA-binding transcriptional ArsR family regulator